MSKLGIEKFTLTYIVDEPFNLGLHAPVLELHSAQFVGTHQRFAIF